MRKFVLIFALSLIVGCGGGSSSGDGMLVEGTLTEAGGAAHKALISKHGAGQKIGNVTICALGECSTTDDAGQWGFVAPESFTGGDTLFTINVHGIEAETVVDLHSGASSIFIDFQHVEGGVVEAESVLIDGEEHGDHDHHDE